MPTLTKSWSARSLETALPATPKKGAPHGLRPSARLLDRLDALEQRDGWQRLRDRIARRLRGCLSEDGAGLLLVLALTLGVTLGMTLPADSDMPYPWNRIGEARTMTRSRDRQFFLAQCCHLCATTPRGWAGCRWRAGST